MSLVAQEQVLFELLFDRTLRERFVQDGIAALSGRGLSDDERRDFAAVRPEALTLDATMRAGFILSQFCRSYPLSFSLVSSLPQGIELLRQLVDVETMRATPLQRLVTFGSRLKEQVQQQSFASAREQALVISILDAEIGMAWTSAALKQEMLSGNPVPDEVDVPADWLRRSVTIAPFVSAAVIPSSHAGLKTALCAVTGASLWRQLSRQPLSAAERQHVLQKHDPRILVARAVVAQPSRCEPVTEHRTVELSEGFASLLGHVNGSVSIADILQQLGQAGAGEALLGSVQQGFWQLAQQGMLTFSVLRTR
ncbi:MAG TPA: hypothetical protein VFX11_05555 [Candidatus Kapabacteria bacterium]|nr:hypothetical protein [Candidatus Kapabacteria bacterium]